MGTILVKIGPRFYKVRVNPKPSLLTSDSYAHLMRQYVRASKNGRLKLMINLERRIRRMEQEAKNPLRKSPHRSYVSKNIDFLLKHPEELTAKTTEMKRKQAIAIALSVWRRAQKKK